MLILLALILHHLCLCSAEQAPFRVHPPPQPLRFHLRHEHALSSSQHTIFRDIPTTEASAATAPDYVLSTDRLTVSRPQTALSGETEWLPEDTRAPNVSSRATLRTLAVMSSDAYVRDPSPKDWYTPSEGWHTGFPFGWEPSKDGFRGHVFVSDDNSTVVIAIKGTSVAWWVGGGGPTTGKDKRNDNLLFSCCCARVDWTWTPVCGCRAGSYKCNQDCVEQSLAEDSLYYTAGINLYNNATYMYPDADIWLTGHSLGGALASLLGATFGAPTVAFEAPAEALAAKRLHLPKPPSTEHIVHVYNTADSIPMGTCNGFSSPCAFGGFAFETRCHLGQILRYDTISKLGWSVGIGSHGISVVIDRVLAEGWEPGPPGSEVPDWYAEEGCEDLSQECYKWDFGGRETKGLD